LITVFGKSVLTASVSDQSDSIRYNWAKLGLALKEEPNKDSKTIVTIPFSEAMQLLSVTDKVTGLSIKGIAEASPQARNSFYLGGYWVQVKYNSKEGYVKGCFLSKYPPPKLEKKDSGVVLLEDFESYLDRHFELLDVDEAKRAPKSDYHRKIKYYEKGTVFESSGRTGWFNQVLIVPNWSIEQGLLLFLLKHHFKEDEGSFYIDGLLRVEGDNSFHVEVDNAVYGIRRFGSILVFTYIGG
jgi:hypothetical protein